MAADLAALDGFRDIDSIFGSGKGEGSIVSVSGCVLAVTLVKPEVDRPSSV